MVRDVHQFAINCDFYRVENNFFSMSMRNRIVRAKNFLLCLFNTLSENVSFQANLWCMVVQILWNHMQKYFFACHCHRGGKIDRWWWFNCFKNVLTMAAIETKKTYNSPSSLMVISDDRNPLSKSKLQQWVQNCFDRHSISLKRSFCCWAILSFCCTSCWACMPNEEWSGCCAKW